MDKKKIWFLHILRGMSCLIILYFHVFELYWKIYPHMRRMWQGEAMDISISQVLFSKFNAFLMSINLNGNLAVCMFFLLSGFVIPMTLEKAKGIPFLIQRTTRILPPYLVGLTISCCSLLLYCLYTNQHWQYDFKVFIINASLVLREWTQTRSIDGVNWTLEIEIKFYIFIAILTQFFDLKKARVVLGLAGFFVLLYFSTFFMPEVSWKVLKTVIESNVPFLTFTLVGTGFYNLYRKNFSIPKFVFYTMTVLTLAYLCTINNASFEVSVSEYYYNGCYALIIFSIFYIANDRIPYNRVLDFFGNISYPLYTVHSITSYVIMTILYKYTQNYYICVFTATAVAITIAYIMHKTVEKMSIKSGKQLSSEYIEFINKNKKIRVTLHPAT